MAFKVCVFDAYGTLFDVASAARELAQEPGQDRFGDVWQAVARDWRHKQLQYTWLRTIIKAHVDFWAVTQDGLDWALEASGINDPELRERLLALYWELSAYPEVPDMLATLRAGGLSTAILSNGSPDMLRGAVHAAGLEELLDNVLSVEDVGVFKPHASVYQMVPDQFGCTRDQVLFVSSNGWDAAGAAEFGFHCVWVNRAQEPVDRLPWAPPVILPDLQTLPQVALNGS